MPLPPDKATTMHTTRPPMPLPHPPGVANPRKPEPLSSTPPSTRTNFGRSPEPSSSSPPLTYNPPPVPFRRPNRFVIIMFIKCFIIHFELFYCSRQPPPVSEKPQVSTVVNYNCCVSGDKMVFIIYIF